MSTTSSAHFQARIDFCTMKPINLILIHFKEAELGKESRFIHEYFRSTLFCDGSRDCPLFGEDESENHCSGKRFQCPAKSKVSIPVSKYCDGTIDCDDGSDERQENCTDRIYCSTLGGAKVKILEGCSWPVISPFNLEITLIKTINLFSPPSFPAWLTVKKEQ